MQFARQVTAFVFPHILQVGCQLGQVGGTLLDLQIELVPLALQRMLFTFARLEQGLRLFEIHIKSQQAGKRHDGDTDAREL